MARTRYYCAATLDGYIAEADDTIDWLTGYEGHYEGNGAQPVEGGVRRLLRRDRGAGHRLGDLRVDPQAHRGGGEWPYTESLLDSQLTRLARAGGGRRRRADSERPLADARREMLASAGRATCGSSAAATSPPVRGRWTTR